MTTVSESPERLEKITRPTEDHMDQMGDMELTTPTDWHSYSIRPRPRTEKA